MHAERPLTPLQKLGFDLINAITVQCDCCDGAGQQLMRHPWMRDPRFVTCPQCLGSGFVHWRLWLA